MTPDIPIRPVNGISSDPLSIRRAELVARINRHRQGEDDDQARDQRRREDRRHDILAEQHDRIWTNRPDADPAQIAGAYDDHGRTSDEAASTPRRHLDASA